MKSVFRLITSRSRGISTDTINCLKVQVEKAESGDLIGIAMVMMYRDRQFGVQTCGELDRNPTFCRGAVAALDDKLARRMWEGR